MSMDRVLEHRKTRYDHYTPLNRLLPLSTPLTVMVEPGNVCNFACVFCPTGDRNLLKKIGRPKGIMPFDLFKNIIDGIREFDQPVKTLNLYKDGEPLLNPDLERMVAHARQREAAGTIFTTTNGSLLTRERAIGLIEAGLDHVRISIEHLHDAGYRQVTRRFDDFATVRKNVETLFEEKQKRRSGLHVHVKILDIGFPPEIIDRFFKEFGTISDSLNIDTLCGWSHSDQSDFLLGRTVTRSLNSSAPLKPQRRVCPEIFKTIAFHFNGQAALCQVDWSHAWILGDIRHQSIKEIWQGEPFRQLRVAMLEEGKSCLPACNSCQFMQGFPAVSDLDDHVQRLLPVYRAACGLPAKGTEAVA